MRFFWIASAYLAICTVSTGCGSDVQPKPDAGADADTGPDVVTVAPDVVEDASPQFLCPNDGENVCDGKCVNVLISMDHCGECDNECVRGTMTCGGETGCECLGGGLMCGTRCYDPLTARKHCGRCDNACAISDACVSGECLLISDNPIVLGVLSATNSARAEGQDCGVNGVKPAVGGVQLNEQLNIAAQVHAEDMAQNNFLAHEGSDGSGPGQRAAIAGYTGSVGENVARGYEDASSVVAGWVDSDGHCKNLMEGSFTVMGVGHAISQTTGDQYWAQVFGDQ